MAKRPSLSAFTTGASAAPDNTPNETTKSDPVQQAVKPAQNPEKLPEVKAAVIPTTIRLPRDAWTQAKIMAAESGIPVNRIYLMALDDYFEAHGRPRLAGI